MSDVPQQAAMLSDVLSIARNGSYATAAMCALLIYDIGIVFPRELDVIWNARWASGKILYILARYGALAYQILLLLSTLPLSASPAFCSAVFNLNLWISILDSSFIQALMALRTSAIYGDKKHMKIPVYGIWIIQAAILMYTAISTTVDLKETGPPFAGASCAFYFTSSLNTSTILGFGSDCVADSLMWLLASVKIYSLVTIPSHFTRIKPLILKHAAVGGESRLAWLIFRDTFFILPANLLLTLSGFIALLKTPKAHAIVVMNTNGVIVALASIASTRTVLNVRAYVSSTSAVSSTRVLSSNDRSLQFQSGRPTISVTTSVSTQPDVEYQEMNDLEQIGKLERRILSEGCDLG